MSGHHHPHSLIFAHAKFCLQNRDDELAGREIIIDQDDLMQTRSFDFYLILDLGLGMVSVMADAFIGHGIRLRAHSRIIVSINTPKQNTALARPLYGASSLPSRFESCVG
jgi:hypothetical protein